MIFFAAKNQKISALMAIGFMVLRAIGDPVQTPGVNLLTDPEFNGQAPAFQEGAGGPYSADWTYTPNYNFFGGPGDLVSQSITTGDLYYYNIDFSLGTSAAAASGVDFAVFWDNSIVSLQELAPSGNWLNYDFTVTAEGTDSSFGLVGNTAFWSSLDNLKVDWTGGIDPPPTQNVPDAPLGLGWLAALLLGLCGSAEFYRRKTTLRAEIAA